MNIRNFRRSIVIKANYTLGRKGQTEIRKLTIK